MQQFWNETLVLIVCQSMDLLCSSPGFKKASLIKHQQVSDLPSLEGAVCHTSGLTSHKYAQSFKQAKLTPFSAISVRDSTYRLNRYGGISVSILNLFAVPTSSNVRECGMACFCGKLISRLVQSKYSVGDNAVLPFASMCKPTVDKTDGNG